MMAGTAGDPLYEHELRVMADLVGGLVGGIGGALVVTGEAGIGKSARLAAGPFDPRQSWISLISTAVDEVLPAPR